MDDYSKLAPYLDSNFQDFEVFGAYFNNKIDYTRASFNLTDSEVTSWVEVGNVSKIGGDLYCNSSSIKTLDGLESVDGELNLSLSPIISLGNLKSVGGNLFLYGTKITTLGNLEKVGGNLDIGGLPLTSLGNLKEVKGEIYYDKKTKVEELLKESGLI